MQTGGKQDAIHGTSVSLASLSSSLLVAPFSVQMALWRLGEEPKAKDFRHDLVLQPPAAVRTSGAAVKRGEKSWRPRGGRVGLQGSFSGWATGSSSILPEVRGLGRVYPCISQAGAGWEHQASVTVRTHGRGTFSFPFGGLGLRIFFL